MSVTSHFFQGLSGLGAGSIPSHENPEKVGKLLKMPCTHDFSTDPIRVIDAGGLAKGRL